MEDEEVKRNFDDDSDEDDQDFQCEGECSLCDC